MGSEVKEKRRNQVDALFGAGVTMWMMMPLSKVWKAKIGVYFGVKLRVLFWSHYI